MLLAVGLYDFLEMRVQNLTQLLSITLMVSVEKTGDTV